MFEIEGRHAPMGGVERTIAIAIGAICGVVFLYAAAIERRTLHACLLAGAAAVFWWVLWQVLHKRVLVVDSSKRRITVRVELFGVRLVAIRELRFGDDSQVTVVSRAADFEGTRRFWYDIHIVDRGRLLLRRHAGYSSDVPPSVRDDARELAEALGVPLRDEQGGGGALRSGSPR